MPNYSSEFKTPEVECVCVCVCVCACVCVCVREIEIEKECVGGWRFSLRSIKIVPKIPEMTI